MIDEVVENNGDIKKEWQCRERKTRAQVSGLYMIAGDPGWSCPGEGRGGAKEHCLNLRAAHCLWGWGEMGSETRRKSGQQHKSGLGLNSGEGKDKKGENNHSLEGNYRSVQACLTGG